VPKVLPARGLLDLAVHPNFAQNQFVYFTYHKVADPAPPLQAGGQPRPQTSLVLARAKWDGKALVGEQDLFTTPPSTSVSGSRIAFGRDGFIYMTTGAPFGPEAQQLNSHLGKVLRLTDEGKPAPGNPFAGRTDAKPEIFTMGHRDQLGLTIHPDTGAVIAEEHGPNGGDEVNLILPGRNYGWPTSSYGRGYDGARISDVPLAQGVEQPLVLWFPSIGPSGMTFYTGDRFPAWKGNLFVGSARWGEIPGTGSLQRVVLNSKLEEIRRESLLGDLHQRFRDVRQGPDGYLYALTDENEGALLRLEPAP
jgi:glucose/arabinose dehydrogenase